MHLREKFNEFLRKGKKKRLDYSAALRIDVVDPKVQVKRKTAFGKLLSMKQKLRYFYGILKDYQFKNLYFKAAYKYVKHPNRNFLIRLYEARMYVVLYRSNFIRTPMEGRQLISYGNVYLNGR